MTRRAAVLVLLLLLAPAGTARAAAPDSMAALGDSFTTAHYSGAPCGATVACPANSWSTGTNSSVQSHYQRIVPLEPKMSGRGYLYAVSGRKMVALDAQAASAVSRGVEYVTILMGLNDLCRETETGMTPVSTFRAQFQTALNRLKTGLPNAKVLVGSVPDPYLLWQNHKDNAAARSAWAAQDVCRVMLGDPLGTSTADVAQRDRVRARGQAFNTALREVCATWANCRFDGGAVARWPWTVTTTDWFHPSVAGQQELSQLLWDAGFDFGDGGGGEEPPPPPPPPPSGPWVDTVLADDPISFWRLGEASGTTAADVLARNAGTYLTGTVRGVPGAISGNTAITTPTAGATGVRVPDAATLDTGDAFTIEAWVKRGSINRTAGLFNRGSGSFHVIFNGTNQIVLRKAGVGAIATSTAKLTDTAAFHHVAVTKAGSTVRIYLDGANVTGPVTNRTLVNAADVLRLGTDGGAGFGGTIDEVALYDHALSASRIAAHVAAR